MESWYLLFDGAFFLMGFILISASLIGLYAWQGWKGFSFFAHSAALGYHYIYHALYYSGLIVKLPFLFMTAQITSFLGSPFFCFFYSFVLKKDFRLQKKHLLHFLFPGAVILINLKYMFVSSAEKIRLLQDAIPARSPEAWPFPQLSQPFLGIVIMFYVIMVIWLAVNSIDLKFVKHNLQSGRFPLNFHLMFLGAHAFVFLSGIGWVFSPGNLFLYRLFPLLIGLSFFSIYFLTLVYPYAMQLGFVVEVSPEFSMKQYTKSRLKNVDIAELEQKLHVLMHEEKLYRDEKITMSAIAEKTGLHTLQLSEYLNVVRNQTFNDYIRSWRVKEAKEIMISDRDFNITRVAFECGFGAQSTFFKAFKLETGMTPTEFRNNTKDLKKERRQRLR